MNFKELEFCEMKISREFTANVENLFKTSAEICDSFVTFNLLQTDNNTTAIFLIIPVFHIARRLNPESSHYVRKEFEIPKTRYST